MINEKLRTARKEAGLSQEQMASRVGVSQQTYSRIEAGTGPVKPRKAALIAEVLKTSVEQLFPGLVDLARGDLERLTDDFTSAGVDVAEQFERAGIDIDENDRTIYWSRAGAGTNFARISGATARRILRELEYQQSSDFVVFDTAGHRVAIRMDAHVVKMSSKTAGEDRDSYDGSTLEGRGNVLEVWRDGASYPDEVAVQPDRRPIGNTAAWSVEHQVQHLFQEIWNKSPRVRLVARVGDEVEAVFFPKPQIVSVVAPLCLFGPKEELSEEPGPFVTKTPGRRVPGHPMFDHGPFTPATEAQIKQIRKLGGKISNVDDLSRDAAYDRINDLLDAQSRRTKP